MDLALVKVEGLCSFFIKEKFVHSIFRTYSKQLLFLKTLKV